MLKKFLKDGILYSVSQFVSKGISFLLIPLYTRLLSPEEYGVVDMVQVMSSIIAVTLALEITQGLGRHFPDLRKKKSQQLYVSSGFWFTLLVYTLFLFLCITFEESLSVWILGDSQWEFVFRVAVIGIFFNGLFYYTQNFLRWNLQSLQYSISNIIVVSVDLSVAFYLIVIERVGVIGFFWGILASRIVGFLYSLFAASSFFELSFSIKRLKKMLVYSAPLVLSSAAIFFATYIDRIAIRDLMELKEVGIYGIGYRFASVITLLIAGFHAALSPIILHNYKDEGIKKEIPKIFNLFICITFSVVLVYCLFAESIISLLTDPRYKEAWTVMPILGLSLIFSSAYIFAPGLSIKKKTKIIAVINVINAILNIGLNYLLIPFIGIVGASVASMISAIITFYLYMYYSQQYYYIPYKWSQLLLSVVIIIGAVIAGAILYFGSLNIIIETVTKAFLVTGGIVLLIIVNDTWNTIKKLIKQLYSKVL